MCLWWACVGPAGLSSDSGLGGSTDGSTDVLVFESVVDSVTEEGEWTIVWLDGVNHVFIFHTDCWSRWIMCSMCFSNVQSVRFLKTPVTRLNWSRRHQIQRIWENWIPERYSIRPVRHEICPSWLKLWHMELMSTQWMKRTRGKAPLFRLWLEWVITNIFMHMHILTVT